jgi:hypothetical protein
LWRLLAGPLEAFTSGLFGLHVADGGGADGVLVVPQHHVEDVGGELTHTVQAGVNRVVAPDVLDGPKTISTCSSAGTVAKNKQGIDDSKFWDALHKVVVLDGPPQAGQATHHVLLVLRLREVGDVSWIGATLCYPVSWGGS